MPAIQTSGLRKAFGDVVALKGLDLEVGEGEIFGLVGPDGAGKTTTMRMLAGVLRPDAGTAQVAGFDVQRATESVKEHIGYMSQRFGLYPDLTVRENIEFYADIYDVRGSEYRERLSRLLSFSGLTPFERRLAGNLSGGMKQKLGLACALIHTPKVLLLDEPTNGVDPVSRRDFWRILYQLVREGVTIFVSTAYLDEAERCNRLTLLHEGRALASESPRKIKELLEGSTWEMHVDRPREAARVAREQLAGSIVAAYGDRLHVSGPGLDETVLRHAFAGTSVRTESARRIEPSLEDVFVAIVARAKADAKVEVNRAG